MLAEIEPAVRVFNLETGYQFTETLALRERLKERYGIEVEYIRPEMTVAEYEAEHGGPLYRIRPDQCCHDRKILPLRRAVVGYDAWISAIRRDQTKDRAVANVVQWDAKFKLVKVNPLLGWTKTNVWEFVLKHQIPYNPLHDMGFPSIGCRPCTQPVAAGDDEPRWSLGRYRRKRNAGCMSSRWNRRAVAASDEGMRDRRMRDEKRQTACLFHPHPSSLIPSIKGALMRVSAKAEYACVAMMELAVTFNDPQPVRIKAIAEAQGIPPRFLVQILLQLKTAGLVASVRGAAGGYQLARPPEQISLADIVNAIDDRTFTPQSALSNINRTRATDVLLSVWKRDSGGGATEACSKTSPLPNCSAVRSRQMRCRIRFK